MSEIFNPIEKARIGVPFRDGKIEGANILDSTMPSTQFNKMSRRTTFYSGNAKYLHSERMHRGSLGVSVSGGVTGIAQVSSSVSGYLGQATSFDSNSLTIIQNIIAIGGNEAFNPNAVTINELIGCLLPPVKEDLLDVLEKFLNIVEVGPNGELSLNGKDPGKVKEWSDAVIAFEKQWGEGFVAAVNWGAIGFASLEMTSQHFASTLKYGGEFNFSVKTPAVGAAIKAAYDGSEIDINQDVSVNVHTEALGAYVEGDVKKWEGELRKQAADDLTKISLEAPQLDVPDSAKIIPSIPEKGPGEKPDPSDKEVKLMNKMGEIKDMKGLEAFAKAQAYEKAKETNKDLTLQEFLERPAPKNIDEKVKEIEDEFGSIFDV